MRHTLALLMLLAAGNSASAQFKLLAANTMASLRGIDAVSDQVAWASGSAGAVLLTTDGGTTWKHCAVPPSAARLDFRGVQAFDAQTAVVMASGPGAQSAIYRTADACATWKLTFADPDQDGFFDSLRKVTGRQMYLLGDPVDGKFSMFYSPDQGVTWFIADDPGLETAKGYGGFAASNSALISMGPFLFFGTSATPTGAPRIYATQQRCKSSDGQQACTVAWVASDVAMPARVASAGVFSLAGRTAAGMSGVMRTTLVAVGGDYQRPDDAAVNTAWSSDGGKTWQSSTSGPAGYRSAVTFSVQAQRWIAVGPSGTDSSRDDGKTWIPLKPASGDAADADKGWNAISLPFVVGAQGKIGKLEPNAFK